MVKVSTWELLTILKMDTALRIVKETGLVAQSPQMQSPRGEEVEEKTRNGLEERKTGRGKMRVLRNQIFE